LTSLTAGNLSGTIPSAVLGNSTHYIGTTAIALNRGTGSQTLTGVSVDGNAGTAGGLAVATGRNNSANQIVRTDASGYIQCGYINSSNGNEGNNSSPSRVWGTNGSDDYLRTYLTSALSVSSAGSSTTSTHQYGAGGSYIASSSNGTAYTAAIQVREAGLGGAQGSAIAYAPRLAFHWSGVVASSIVMEASGRIAIVNNPGTSYEAFACGVMTGTATNARYADLAENYLADAEYAPGTVVVFGGDKEVTISTVNHDTAVAGVISTNPAHLMNAELDNGIAVAMTGRVPCRVQGPVRKGQLVVTSDTPGVAQAIDNSKFLPGCVIGKALEAINTNTIETIEVVVGRF
jgi:uncharacterized protein YunC (DUF1805 family)